MTSAHAAPPVYEGCTPPPASFRHVLHATPATLAAVLRTAGDGDAVYLSSGQYGRVDLKGDNREFVLVAAEPGQKPELSSLTVTGSHWWMRGLTVTGLAPKHMWGKWPAHDALVRLGPADNVIFEANEVNSTPGAFPWKKSTEGQLDDAPVSSGVLANETSCTSIVGNTVSNVFNAIQVEGDQSGNVGKYFIVSNNTITDFAGDGIDHSVSFASIDHNHITNGHNICDYKCIHMDGIQGWTYYNRPGIVNENVVIDSNVIIDRTRLDLTLPTTDMQGITIWDGFWKNVSATNNVVVTNTWNGITLEGVDGMKIANNTVLPSGDRQTWIQGGGTTHQGGQSRNVVIRNNIAVRVQTTNETSPVHIDHNLVVMSPSRVVVAFDPKRAVYDLHPRPGGGADGHGSREDAPATDADGKSRTERISIGAYN